MFHYFIIKLHFFSLLFASNFSLRFTLLVFTSKWNKAKHPWRCWGHSVLRSSNSDRTTTATDHYRERIEQTTEDESIEHLSKLGTPSDRANSNSRGGERSDVLDKIVQNLQLESGEDSSSSQPREGQSGASTTREGTGAGDLQRSRHSSSDSSMASHTSAETDAKQSEAKFKYNYLLFFTFFYVFFRFFSLFFAFFRLLFISLRFFRLIFAYFTFVFASGFWCFASKWIMWNQAFFSLPSGTKFSLQFQISLPKRKWGRTLSGTLIVISDICLQFFLLLILCSCIFYYFNDTVILFLALITLITERQLESIIYSI